MSALPPLRWSVVIVRLDPVVGHEQAGERRCLVVSYEPFHRSGRVTICPITASRSETRYPNEVPIAIGEAGQSKAGVILCHQVRTISINRLSRDPSSDDARVRYVTDPGTRRAVREGLQRHLGLDIPETIDGAAD